MITTPPIGALPKLPHTVFRRASDSFVRSYTADQMRAYARAAIEADRAAKACGSAGERTDSVSRKGAGDVEGLRGCGLRSAADS